MKLIALYTSTMWTRKKETGCMTLFFIYETSFRRDPIDLDMRVASHHFSFLTVTTTWYSSKFSGYRYSRKSAWIRKSCFLKFSTLLRHLTKSDTKAYAQNQNFAPRKLIFLNKTISNNADDNVKINRQTSWVISYRSNSLIPGISKFFVKLLLKRHKPLIKNWPIP